MSEPGPWIEWSGGERPVHAMQLVHIQFRGETRDEAEAGNVRFMPAQAWSWHHHGGDADIIAYRKAAS